MKKLNKIRGGSLIARALKDKGIRNVFTLSGGFCNPALEGFMECQINVINCPHEQIAGHLADGHTRITRKPSVCLVGPEGFANAVPAMMEAWGERSPVIFITGSSSLKRQGAGGFKEIDDVSIAAPLTKYSASITDGNRIREFVDKAYCIATNGYPGAVHLSVPVDIMFSSFLENAGLEERPFKHEAKPIMRAWPDPNQIEKIENILLQSKKPVLIGGHGILWSRAEKKFEERLPIMNKQFLEGSYDLRINKLGYEKYQMRFDVAMGEFPEHFIDLKPKKPGKAALRSLFVPGRGQIYSSDADHRNRMIMGATYFFSTAALIGTSGILWNEFFKSRDVYEVSRENYLNAISVEDVSSTQSIMLSDHSTMSDKRSSAVLVSSLTAGIWLFNAIDAYFFFPAKYKGIRVSVKADSALLAGENRVRANLKWFF